MSQHYDSARACQLSKDTTPAHRNGATRPTRAQTRENPKAVSPPKLEFKNSRLFLEFGPAGTVGRILYDDGTKRYVGPLPEGTLDSLFEVGEVVR